MIPALIGLLILSTGASVQAAGPHNPDFEPSPEVNLDTFMVPFPNEAVSLRVGHHQAASQGLLFEGSENWGVSADASLDAINSDLSLFGVHATDGGKAARGVSLSDGSNYFTGGNFQARLPVPWSGLSLSASYVMGRESEVDTFGGRQFGRPVGQGFGYSLGLESSWFRNQVRIELERALTRFARDSVNDEATLADSAYSAKLTYAPDLGSLPLDWEVGAESLNVGPHFRSPANQGLSRNRSLDRVFTRIRPGDNWSLGYRYQEHGAGGGNARPETEGDEVFADMTFRISDWFRVKPYGQFEREYNRHYQSTAYHSLLSLTVDTWLIPGNLFYRNTVRVDKRRSQLGSGFGGDRRRRYVASELKWHALEPSRQRLGLDVNLSFSADEIETERDRNSGLDSYKLLLSISSSRF